MEIERNCDYFETSKCCGDQGQECKKFSEESDQISPDLEKKLHQIARKEGFTDYTIHAKHISPDGNNYMGILYEVTIKGTTKEGDGLLELFVKAIIPNKENVKVCELDRLYDAEMYVYKELADIINELQDAANIPLKERFNFVKCYKESDSEFIIMDNMAKKGFGTYCRTEVVSLKYTEKAIENLAKFHAMSFVLQEKKPKHFNGNIKTLKMPINFEGEWKKHMENICNFSCDHLDKNSQQHYKKLTPDVIMKKLNKCYNNSEPKTAICLCHGDFKTGNILSRQVDDEIEVVPVDYQLLHYGMPTTDLMFLLFTSTDREFRKKHLEYLKNFYFISLEIFMKKFDMHIEDFFPKKEYERMFKETLDFGLITASWVLPFQLSDDDNLVDLGKTTLTEVKFSKNERLGVRMQEMVEEFIEWGYL